MSNFRSRAFLDLCYTFDCMLRIPGVCEGGTGEPCHSNWPQHGKGMSLKAHDCYVVPGCRSCHRELDQGSKLSGEQRYQFWEHAFWKFLPMAMQEFMPIRVRDFGAVGDGKTDDTGAFQAAINSARPQRNRKTKCLSSKMLPRR